MPDLISGVRSTDFSRASLGIERTQLEVGTLDSLKLQLICGFGERAGVSIAPDFLLLSL